MNLFHPPSLGSGCAIVLLALALEALLGYPAWLNRAIGHPVAWIGRLIAFLDRRLNRIEVDPADRRRRGMVALGLVLVATFIAALVVLWLGRHAPFGWLIEALAASTMIAQRSLHQHVAAVADVLEVEGVEGGRAVVARIVGRETQFLDEAGVARGAIESLAENFSDGVVAPAFWLALLGLPGILLYKAINTADSMIGHRIPRYLDFGRAAARLDDWVNLPAARLSALLIVAAGFVVRGANGRAAWRVMRRDGRRHRSPNAGWPEAAMAGALELKLAGPRVYEGVRVEEPWLGDGDERPGPAQIRAALKLYRAACGALWLLAAAGALVAVLLVR